MNKRKFDQILRDVNYAIYLVYGEYKREEKEERIHTAVETATRIYLDEMEREGQVFQIDENGIKANVINK